MRIGIDARSLTPKKGGIGHYLSEILDGRSDILADETLQLFSHRSINYPKGPGLEHHVYPAHLGLPWYLFWSHLSISRQAPDVFWGTQNLLPLWLPAEIPAVLTIPDCVHRQSLKYSPSSFYHFIHRFYMPKSIRRSSRILTFSHFVADEISRYFGVASKFIEITPLGVNAAFFRNRIDPHQTNLICERWNLTPPYILAVGTLEPRKNLQTLLRAFSLLPARLQSQHQLVFVGKSGWRQKQFDKDLRSYRAKSRLRILGYVPQQDLPYLYAGAKLLVFPSYYEGFGLPLLEAMAAGCPVLSSKTSAIKEVVGSAGILIEADASAEDWSRSLLKVLECPTLQESLRVAGLAHANKFSWNNCRTQTFEILRYVAR